MSKPLIFDSLINLFGLLGLAATILALRGRGTPRPMRVRWSFGLGLLAVLYLARGLFWLTENQLFDMLTVAVALLVPLGALVIAEGLLRRHAPLAVKLLVSGGALAAGLLLLLTELDAALVLGSFVGISLAAIGLTCAFALRDLSSAERRTIGSLGLCLLLLIPAALSDFRALFPDTPARLSPLALLVFVWVGLNSGTMGRGRWIADLVVAAVIAAIAGVGLAAVGDRGEAIATAAAVMSAMLFYSVVGLIRSADPASEGLRQRLASTSATTRDELLLMLSEDPLFAGATLLDAAKLADHEVPGLSALCARRPVLRLSEAPWDLSPDDLAGQSARALLEREGATHLLLVEAAPLSLLALSCPSIAAGSGVEADIALAQRLLQLTPPRRLSR